VIAIAIKNNSDEKVLNKDFTTIKRFCAKNQDINSVLKIQQQLKLPG
jgi:hypothetical protein